MDRACSQGEDIELILCANPLAQFYSYQEEIENAVIRVLRSDRYILGNEVEAFEQEFAEFIGVPCTVGVGNGTDAIELALRAIEIKPGDEVITVSHTAVATVAAIEAAGAIPVFVDIDPNFYTMEPDQLGEVLTSRTRAVIAVHLYGQAAELDKISDFCEKNRLFLIEDVSQAHGAKWHDKRLGSIGHIGCFSCYPTKNLGAIGDAGILTTRDEDLARKIRMLREYGWQTRYISEIAGRNSRLDELQAAILRVKLRYLDDDNSKRETLAKKYNRLLDGVVKTPQVRDRVKHVFHLYVVKSLNRGRLINYLKSRNIQVGIHYPVPIHLQPAYKGRVKTAKSMVVTETLATQLASLPIYPELGQDLVDQISIAVLDSCV